MSALTVLHVAQPTVDGVAVVVCHLIRDQVSRGWNVTLACPSDGWLASRARRLGASHRPWSARRSPGPSIGAETWRLSRIVRQCRPDIVHLHSAKAGLAGRLWIRGQSPTIYQPHGWSFLAAPPTMSGVVLSWERLAVRWTGAIACVSAGERAAGESAGIRGNWLDAQNGIDLAAFPVADRAEQRCARRQLDISDTPLAVCVARVCRQKGQDVLLAAWPAVRAAVPNAQLALVGGLGAGGESMVRRETMPAGAFHVGQQDDPRPWYAAANVVVAPSRWEGASLGLMEAMACGRSIVATDVAGVGENVPAGTGAVVPRADLHALATALSNRLADPAIADTEGAAAAMFAQRAFSITTKTDALVDQYRCVINKPPRTSGRDGHSAL